MEDKAFEVRPSLKDYTKRMCARFLKAFGGHLRPKNAPSTANLFENLCDVKGEADCPDGHRLTAPGAQHVKHLQGVLGELLWLTRTVGGDCAYAVCQLASRIQSWSNLCDKQLRHLIGFLMNTWDCALIIRAEPGDAWEDLQPICHTDAGLALPRSHSGLFIFAESQSGSFCPLDWASRHQKLASTSSCASETIAAHEGPMTAMPAAPPFADGKAHHFSANQSLLANIQRGYSERLAYLQRALRLRTSFIQDLVSRGLAISRYVNTSTCRAGPFTRAPPSPACTTAAEALGLRFGDGRTTEEGPRKVELPDA